jgi:hypothetical protein
VLHQALKRRNPPMQNTTSRQTSFTVLVLISWLLIAAQLFVQYWTATAGSLFDSDDAMRLVEVRSFLAGHGWFNLHEARIDPPHGYDSHWSRLIDAGLAGLFLLLHAVFNSEMAERLMRATWPVLWILPTMLAVAAIAWRIAGRDAAIIALGFAVIGMPAFHQFTPGRIDHHNVQIALSLLTLAATVWSDRVRFAPWAAGALTGLALTIGFESLPYLALGGVALAARYVSDRDGWQAMRAYGLSLAGTTAALFLLCVSPDRWAQSACDAIAFNSAMPVMLGGLALSCGAAWLRSESARLRLAVVATSAVVALLALSLSEPRCLAGPYAMMDPTAKALWLDNVPEMRPFLTIALQSPVFGAWMASFPLLALLASLLLARDRFLRSDFGFLVNVAALLVAVALTIAMIRGFSYGIWLGMPLVAAWALRLFASLKLATLPARALMTFLLAPLTLSLAASMIAQAAAQGGAPSEGRNCFKVENYAALASLPAGNVATNILDYAPHVLALTPHSVMAAPYHRLSPAILAEYRAFTSSLDDARGIFLTAHVNYLAICGSRGPVGLGEQELKIGLWGRLRVGSVPAWLELVPETQGQAFAIYRVKP